MRVIGTSGLGSDRSSIPISLKSRVMRNVARIVGVAGLAALVLVGAPVGLASAHGGGGGGGGGHGGSMGGGHGGFMMGGAKGGNGMMGGFGFGGPSTTSSQYAVSCRNNRSASHCRR